MTRSQRIGRRSARVRAILAVVSTLLACDWALAQEAESQPAQPSEAAKPPARALATVPPKGDLPAGVLARIDGRDVTEEDLMRFTFRKNGMREFLDLVDELLVEKKATALGVMVTDDEVKSEVERNIQADIERSHGDRQRFLDGLDRQFYTLESFKRWRMDAIRPRLLLERCILATRTVDENGIRKKFEELYGQDGVVTQIRQILIAKSRPGGGAPEELARELMGKLEKAPESFPQLVEQYSDHAPSKRSGGLIPNYRPGRGPRMGSAGEAFDEAVRGLKEEGQIAGPIASDLGFHIVQLVKRTTTRFDDVKVELRAQLEKEQPTSSERIRFKQRLREEATIEM